MAAGAIHADLARSALKSWQGVRGEPEFVMHRENTVYRVATAKGPAALRIHRAGYHARAAIESELAWMAYLAANGLAVPAPFASADGPLVVEVPDDAGEPRCVDLLSWLPGAPLGQSNAPLARSHGETVAIFQAIGEQMALMHMASDDWATPAGFDRHAWNKEGLLGDASFWGQFWTASCLDMDEAVLLLAARERLAREVDSLAGEAADYGLIHADLVRENVLVHEGRVAFIDFDDAGFGYRLFDIATALHKNRAEANFEDMKAALIDGYRKRRRLSDLALESLPLFMLLRSLTYLGWAEARKDEPGMAARQSRFKADAIGLARAYFAGNGL